MTRKTYTEYVIGILPSDGSGWRFNFGNAFSEEMDEIDPIFRRAFNSEVKAALRNVMPTTRVQVFERQVTELEESVGGWEIHD